MSEGVGEGVGSWLICFSLVSGLCAVCFGLFALPLCVIGRLCSVIVALPLFVICRLCSVIVALPYLCHL